MVKHIVLISFKDNVSNDSIERVMRVFNNVTDSIDGVVGFEQGRSISNGDKRCNYSHCVILTLRSNLARDVYLTHIELHNLKARLLPLVSVIEVIDFELFL
ncbi:Dabb family protein [Salmonella enterica]|nr:Dabb family protein [Salmonella enterica]EAR4440543.1 Dabb family protein [Salmonella enterica]ECP3589161.1 Dabb family protein [Salmonella enterica]